MAKRRGQGVTVLSGGASASAEAGDLVSLMTSSLSSGGGVTVDRAKGEIRGVSVMTIGPAAGHGFDLDERSLETLLSAWEANAKAVKCRLSHPEVNWVQSRDGAELLVGRPLKLWRDGDRVRADIQIPSWAEHSPLGDMRSYLLGIASENPELLGLSVVVRFDYERVVDPQSGEVIGRLGRVKYLKAIDFVDDPAANRNGLLGRSADESADMNLEGEDMKISKRARKFLEKRGLLASGASEAEAQAAVAKLSGKDRLVFAALNQDQGDNAELTGQIDAALRALSVDPADPTQALAQQSGAAAAAPPPAAGTPANGSATGAAALSSVPSGGGGATPPASGRDDQVRQAVAEALAAERAQVAAIRTLAAQTGLGETWALGQIAAGASIEAAREAALEGIAQRSRTVEGLSVQVGDDGRESLVAAIADAMTLRAGVPIYEEGPNGGPRLDAAGNVVLRQAQVRTATIEHLSLVEQGRMFLGQMGVSGVQSLRPEDVARLCLDRIELAGRIGSVALQHSTSDFPGVFANVLNKVLLPGYEEEPSTWEQWANVREVKDFRPVPLKQMGQLPVPMLVREGAEYEYVTMGEKGEEIQAFKYGYLLAMTWEMFVNDDLNAFTEGAFGFAQSAKALENDLIYAKLLSNPTMAEDSTALFHTDHNNIDEGTEGPPTLGRLAAMLSAMALQRGIAPKAGQEGRTLNLRPNTLLVPVLLEPAVSQIVSSMVDPTKQNNTPNYSFVRSLKVVSDSRLDANSTTKWYSCRAGLRNAPAGLIAKLRGYPRPSVEKINTGTSVDGVTWKLRHVAGAAIPEWRVWQTNGGEEEEEGGE